jgi:hypothetical protein
MIPLFHPPDQNIDRMIAELRDTLSGRWWEQGLKVDLFSGSGEIRVLPVRHGHSGQPP